MMINRKAHPRATLIPARRFLLCNRVLVASGPSPSKLQVSREKQVITNTLAAKSRLS